MSRMGKLMISSGEKSPDMRYASGVSTPDDIIWFQADSVKGVIASPLEFDRLKATGRCDTAVFPTDEFSGPHYLDILKCIAQRYKLDGFVVPEDFPLLMADRLRENGLCVEAVETGFFPEREFKSSSEVALITQSLRAAEAGCRRAIDVLKESDVNKDGVLVWNGEILTSEILRSEIDCTMLRMSCLPTGTICAGAAQGAQPHNQGSGPLYANTPIVMDIFPKSSLTGYWGDLTRTVVKGKAQDVVKKAFDAVFEARELAKSMLKIGADPAEIHNAAAAAMEKRGFQTGVSDAGNFGFFHGLGHGVGLDIHEAPRVSPRNPQLFRGGEVITIEPGLYYPEWGGIRLEDMAYISPDGNIEILTKIETELEL